MHSSYEALMHVKGVGGSGLAGSVVLDHPGSAISDLRRAFRLSGALVMELIFFSKSALHLGIHSIQIQLSPPLTG